MSVQWTADIIGKMHIPRISNEMLARQLGYTPEYVSMVLNGKRTPKNAETKFRAALDELIAERAESGTS